MGPAVGPNMALSAAAGDLRAAPPMALRRFRRLTAVRRKVHCAAKKKKAAPSGSSEGGSQKEDDLLSMGDFMLFDEDVESGSLAEMDDMIGGLLGLGLDDDDDAELDDDLAAIFEREISDAFPSPYAAARTAQEIRRARGLPTAEEVEGLPSAGARGSAGAKAASSAPVKPKPPQAKPPKSRGKKISSSSAQGLSSLADLGDFASLLSEAEAEMGGAVSPPSSATRRSSAGERSPPALLGKPGGGAQGLGPSSPSSTPSRKGAVKRTEKPARPAGDASEKGGVGEGREWEGFLDDDDIPVSMEEIFREMATEMRDERSSAKRASKGSKASLMAPPSKPAAQPEAEVSRSKPQPETAAPLGPPRSPSKRQPVEPPPPAAPPQTSAPPTPQRLTKPAPKAVTAAPAPTVPPKPAAAPPPSPSREPARSKSPLPAPEPSPPLRPPPPPREQGAPEKATSAKPAPARAAQPPPPPPTAEEQTAPAVEDLASPPSPPPQPPTPSVPDEAPAPPIVAGYRNNEVVVSEDNSFDEEDYDDTTAEEMGAMENNETVVSADESPTQDGPNVGEMGETTAVLAPKPFGARAGGVRSDGQRAISAGDSFVVSVLRVTKGGLVMRSKDGVYGFMPISQISPGVMTQAKSNDRGAPRAERLRALIGARLKVTVYDIVTKPSGVVNVLRPQGETSAWVRLKTDIESLALSPEAKEIIERDMRRKVWTAEVLSVISDGSSIVRIIVDGEDGTAHEVFGLLPWHQLAFEGCEAEELLPGDMLDVAVTNLHPGNSRICNVSKRVTGMKLDVLQQRIVEDQCGRSVNATVIAVSQRVVTVKFELESGESRVSITSQLFGRQLSRRTIETIPDTFRAGDVLPVVVSGVSKSTGQCIVNAALLEPLMGFVGEEALAELEVLAVLRQPITARVLFARKGASCLVRFNVLSMDNTRSTAVLALAKPPRRRGMSDAEVKANPYITPAVGSDVEVKVVDVNRAKGRVWCRILVDDAAPAES